MIAKNKKAQLVKVLDQASRVNKTYLPIDRIIENGEKEDTSSSTDTIASATVLDLFWPPTILIRSLVPSRWSLALPSDHQHIYLTSILT